MPRKKDEFLPLSIKSVSVANSHEEAYLVYKNSHNYEKVYATTAYEAIEKSGIKSPYKVINQININNSSLLNNKLTSEIKANQEVTENQIQPEQEIN